MIDRKENDQLEAAREIASMLSEFRQEVVGKFFNAVIDEMDEVSNSDFDLAKGRGRGPWWADGGES